MLSPSNLVIVLLVLAVVSLLLAILLFFIKLMHRRRIRAVGVRRAHYIGALGELVARNALPMSSLAGWGDDPVFLEVLFDFLTIVTGDERATIERLIERLDLRTQLAADLRTSRRLRRRLQALSYMVEVADESLEDLFAECLDDGVVEVRLHAARGLARIGNPESVGLILDRMEAEELWVADRLADVLTGFGPAAVPALSQYLVLSQFDENRDAELLRDVIRVLDLIGDLSAEPALLTMLDADERLLRIGAASALGAAGTPACVPALIRALADSEWQVRARAAVSLGVFSDPRAIAPLGAALRDPAWWVRQDSAKALANHLGGEARLIEALSDDDPYARDAALHQLGLKGTVRDAYRRIEAGAGTELDRRILGAALTAKLTEQAELAG
jgi:HEAT repeat protein